MLFDVILCLFVSFVSFCVILCHLKSFCDFCVCFFLCCGYFWVVEVGYCARFLCCGKCLMLLWCFAMADFFVSFFVFCVCRSLGVGGFRHVEIVVCCCGVLLWMIFCVLFHFFVCAGRWAWVVFGLWKSSYVAVCFCVSD